MLANKVLESVQISQIVIAEAVPEFKVVHNRRENNWYKAGILYLRFSRILKAKWACRHYWLALPIFSV